jgi:hypothetical protein
MNDFVYLKEEVRSVLARYKFGIDDIDYINLSNVYSTSAELFFELEEEPPCLEGKIYRVDWCSSWDLPDGFKIVMKDETFFIYVNVSDEYYSRWVHVQLPQMSPVIINKSNHHKRNSSL